MSATHASHSATGRERPSFKNDVIQPPDYPPPYTPGGPRAEWSARRGRASKRATYPAQCGLTAWKMTIDWSCVSIRPRPGDSFRVQRSGPITTV